MIWYLKYNQLHINEDIILFFKETENILLMIFRTTANHIVLYMRMKFKGD